LNGVCLRNCKTLNHPEETLIPTKTDTARVINSLNLKGNLSFSVNLDDIQRLIIANKKKTMAAAKNRLILEKRLIKKIFLKPKASNHKKSVYRLTKPDIERIRIITIPIPNLINQFFFIT